MKKVVYCLFALMLMLSACSDDGDEIVRTLSVDKTELIFEDLEQVSQLSFRINSNVGWRITGNSFMPARLTASKGKGNAEIKVSFDQATMKKTEFGVLIVECLDDPLLNARITVKCVVKKPNILDTVEDELFKTYLIDSIFEGSSYATAYDAAIIKTINVSGNKDAVKEIKSLKGIEYFKNLEDLRFDYNKVTSIDLSKNNKLKTLHCSNNELTALNLSQNPSLEILYCANNELTSLDLSKNVELSNLKCGFNNLTKLDLSKQTKLYNLICESNKLTSLDLSNNKELTSLTCSLNELTSLNVANLESLRSLYCESNKLSELDLSGNKSLRSVYCEKNKLTTLDLTSNVALTSLYCSDNLLTSINLSKNVNLTYLYCTDNQLTSLDVSNSTKIKSLYSRGNLLGPKSIKIKKALYDKASLVPLKQTGIYDVVD